MRGWLKELLSGKPQASPDDPPFWKDYIQRIHNQGAADTSLSEADFVVFDTETTGLDVKADKVLSVGAVRVCKGQVLVQDSFEFVVRNNFV